MWRVIVILYSCRKFHVRIFCAKMPLIYRYFLIGTLILRNEYRIHHFDTDQIFEWIEIHLVRNETYYYHCNIIKSMLESSAENLSIQIEPKRIDSKTENYFMQYRNFVGHAEQGKRSVASG